MLRIHLLGPLQLLRNDESVVIKRRKSRALLLYVAAQPQPVSRRQLATLLWPDHTDQTARHNLRTTLYTLRQELDDVLVVDDEWVGLAEGVFVDVHAFARALNQPASDLKALEAALALYRGDFLADFDTPDTEEYDDWLAVTREHYRRLAIRGFQQLSALHEQTGSYAAALEALSRALAIDPFQEDLQRAGLRLHYLAGDRAGAIRRYEEFRRLLEEEMGVPPMNETRALYDAIITDSLPTPPVPALSGPVASVAPVPATQPEGAPPKPSLPLNDSGVPFIGRRSELERLHALAESGQLIVIEGEPGIGKTHLIEAFMAERRAAFPSAPPLVLIGRARQLESRLPYRPVIEALRGILTDPAWPSLRTQLTLPPVWWQEIQRLLPELGDAQDKADWRAPDASRLWEGVSQFVAAVSRRLPLLILIDDLHWADSATLGLIGYLVRQIGLAGLPVTLLATSRAAAPRTDLAVLYQSLLREERLARLTLAALTMDDVIELAQQISPTYSYPLGNWLYRTSEGNPFILVELLRFARDRGIISADGSVNLSMLPTTPVVPPTVYTLIEGRLAALSEGARRVLDAAVAVGREFDFEVAARAAALSDHAALDALDELRQARLIHEIAPPVDPQAGDCSKQAADPMPTGSLRFAFDHTLTLEVAYRQVGESRHRLLHRRVAAALESIHNDRLDEVAGLLAQHYAEGDQPVQAAKYARLAGQRAVRLAAWRSAVSFFRQALPGVSDDERSVLLAELGRALFHAGESSQAIETLRDALALPGTRQDEAVLLQVLQLLGEALLMQARYGEVIELAQAFVSHRAAPIRIVSEFMWAAALSLEGLALEDAASHLLAAEKQIEEAGLAQGSVLPGQVQFELGNIDAQQGRLEAAVARYRRTLAIAQSLASDEALSFHILACNNLAYHLHLLGDPQAQEYAQRGLALAQERGMLTHLPYLLSTLGELALDQGDLEAAEMAFRQGLAHAQRIGHPERTAGLTANLGLVALARGQRELAIHRFSTALAQADAVPTRFLAAQIRLWLAPLLPREAAMSTLAEARNQIHAGNYLRLLPRLAELEAELADPSTDSSHHSPTGAP